MAEQTIYSNVIPTETEVTRERQPKSHCCPGHHFWNSPYTFGFLLLTYFVVLAFWLWHVIQNETKNPDDELRLELNRSLETQQNLTQMLEDTKQRVTCLRRAILRSGSPFQPHPTRTPAERNKLEEEIWMNNLNSDSSDLCPPDGLYIYKKCYYFSETKMSYKEKNSATSGCRLASIPKTHIFLRRLIAVTDQEFWVGVDTMDEHQSSETKMGRWRDGSMEELLEGVGSCIKLGRHLKLENCFLELRWICEKDAAKATKDLIL